MSVQAERTGRSYGQGSSTQWVVEPGNKPGLSMVSDEAPSLWATGQRSATLSAPSERCSLMLAMVPGAFGNDRQLQKLQRVAEIRSIDVERMHTES